MPDGKPNGKAFAALLLIAAGLLAYSLWPDGNGCAARTDREHDQALELRARVDARMLSSIALRFARPAGTAHS